MQNGGPMLFLLPTKAAKTLKQPQPKREPSRVIAIQGSRFQKDEWAVTRATLELRTMQRSFSCLGFESLAAVSHPLQRILDFGFPFAACPANEARKGRVRKTERTNRNCIARSPTTRR